MKRKVVEVPDYQLDLGKMGKPLLVVKWEEKTQQPEIRILFGEPSRYLNVNGAEIKGCATMLLTTPTGDVFRYAGTQDKRDGMPSRVQGGTISWPGWDKLKAALTDAVNAWVQTHKKDYVRCQQMRLRNIAATKEQEIRALEGTIVALREEVEALDRQADELAPRKS